LKILLYSSIIPYPLTEGGKVAQFTFIRELVDKHQVHFITSALQPADIANLNALASLFPGLMVTNIADRVVQQKNFVVKLADAFSWYVQKKYISKKEEGSAVEHPYYMEPVPSKSIGFLKKLKTIIEDYNPDIVQVDFTDNADVINVGLHYKTLLVAHELKYVSLQQAAIQKGYEQWYINYLLHHMKPVEISYLKQYDGIVVFSKEDVARLQMEGLSNVHHCGFAVAHDMFSDITEEAYNVKNLVFIGPDTHHPNKDALQWYYASMAKKIKKEFNLNLHVIGNWSTESQHTFQDQDAIKFLGFADDLKLACKNAIMLAPLRIGSGIRTKILDAMAMGVPVISTGIGCEGIEARNGMEIMIAETDNDFIDAISNLLNNKTLLNQLRKNANKLVRENFSPSVIYNRRMEVYQQLITR
jgi:glycosyltransferase involved in cell wall biosynthesis